VILAIRRSSSEFAALLRQRVFEPNLSKTELAALRQNAKELRDWTQEVFGENH